MLDLLLKQIFGQPFMLMGIVVFIGYICMKESFSKSLIGGLKASIGVLVLGIGSGGLIGHFNKILNATSNATGLVGAGLNTYPTMANGFEKMDAVLGAGNGATWGIYTLLLAFIINIILVYFQKYTKIKTVFLTGNVMLVQAGISVYIVWRFLGLDMLPTVIIASIVTAIYWGIFSTLLAKPTDEITGGAGFSIAHQQMFMSYLAYKIAPKLGNAEKDDIENKKLPEFLNILQDNVISTAIIMFVSVAAMFLMMKQPGIDQLKIDMGMAGLKNNLIFLLWISLILTADIYVLLAGVRMFVGELMVSFKGISDRLLPGSVAGVDCAAIYAFSPKAVVFGLLFGSIGEIIGLAILKLINFNVFVIPGFIPLFFDNATVSIFANKFGGYKAAMILCTICGILQIVGSAFAIQLMELQWWQGSIDYSTVWLGIIYIFKIIGQSLGFPIAG